MTKPQQAGGASVREMKAAALDEFIKKELERKRAADAAKTARLKALRLARDAEEAAAEKPEAPPKRVARKGRHA